MGSFRRIGHRILFVVGLVVVFGLAGVIFLYAERQERSILEQNERALVKVTQSVSQGLEAIMLKGYADIGYEFALRLKALKGSVDYRIMRIDGREAFVDTATIKQVNQRLGKERFKLRPEMMAPQVIDPASPAMQRLFAENKRQLYYETLPSGVSAVTVLEPLLSDDSCADCHEGSKPVRGVIKLTTSLETVDSDIRNTWLMSIVVVGAGMLFIFTAVYFVAQRSVVKPIRAVTRAMSEAARGDLSVSVPVIGRDEIGRMAESFNQMSGELLRLYDGLQDEQNKLTTIILGAHEGIVVTDAANNVVLVNPAASQILGKSEQQIVESGIFMLVDDQEWMEWRFASVEDEANAGVIEYKGRILSIQASTTRSSSGRITGSAAIVRDVTDEKRLEAELKRLAVTDGLTGLYNRRHFDEVMATEFQRARRYQTGFALLMLDVDHFKKFNDSYGHDCGDRVLKAIGVVLRDIAAKQRPVAEVHGAVGGIACRYGGEELAIILPEQTQNEAAAVADEVRCAIEALLIDGLQVTVSIGVAIYQDHCKSAADIVIRADGALYRAKEAGRNCVIVAN